MFFLFYQTNLSIIVFAQYNNVKYNYVSNGTTYETDCWGPKDVGTPSEQFKTAECVKDTGSTECKKIYPSASVDLQAYAFYISEGDPSCYKGTFKNSNGQTITFFTSYSNNKIPKKDGFEVYINKPLIESFNIPATTLKECQTKISPNRVQFSLTNRFYPTVEACYLTEYQSSDKYEDLRQSNGCYYMRPGYVYDAGRLAPKKEASCSCYYGGFFFRNVDPVQWTLTGWATGWDTIKNAWSLVSGEFTNISVHYGTDPWFFGTKNLQSYKSGSTIEQNITACEAAHPKRYYSPFSGTCFSTLDSCREDLKSQCDGHNGEYFYNDNYYTKITDAVKAATTCTGPSCYITTRVTNVKRCDCSVAYNVNYNVLLCSSGQAGSAVGVDCSEKCKLIPVSAAGIQPIFPKSPLAIINVIVNLLFWFAVMLLILNFITAGIEMVQSGNEPQKMKEATERVQSTLFGFIFVLLVSGVINYLITLVGEVIK